jgi:hypothetical protein
MATFDQWKKMTKKIITRRAAKKTKDSNSETTMGTPLSPSSLFILTFFLSLLFFFSFSFSFLFSSFSYSFFNFYFTLPYLTSTLPASFYYIVLTHT